MKESSSFCIFSAFRILNSKGSIHYSGLKT